MDQALFGPALASSVLDLLEEKLQEAMKATEELRKVPLGAVDPSGSHSHGRHGPAVFWRTTRPPIEVIY